MGEWDEQAVLQAPDRRSGDRFGATLALDKVKGNVTRNQTCFTCDCLFGLTGFGRLARVARLGGVQRWDWRLRAHNIHERITSTADNLDIVCCERYGLRSMTARQTPL